MDSALKLLVFSDSHTDVETMVSVFNAEAPDAVLHLGDHLEDARLLKNHLAGIPLYAVRGNTDYGSPGEDERVLDFNGKRILLCHGHHYNVKSGLAEIFRRGINAGVDAALFGHTHEAFVCRREGLWLMNPGRIGQNPGGTVHSSYGIITAGAALRCEIAEYSRLRRPLETSAR